MKPLIIFDRDGTLNKRIPESYTLDESHLLRSDRLLDIFHQLSKINVCLAVATNQACIEKKLSTLNAQYNLTQILFGDAIEITRGSIFICPHLPSSDCNCRKPKPGLILAALEQYGVDPNQTYMIGDSETDAEAAESAGVKFVGVCWDSPCQGESCQHELISAINFVLAAESLPLIF